MHARLLYMLHDAADEHFFTITDAVNIDFDSQIEEAIQQHRAVIGHFHRLIHIDTQIIFVMDNFHRAAAQDIGRPHHQRVTHLGRNSHGLLYSSGRAIGWLLQIKRLNQFLESFTVFSKVN